MTVLFDSVAPDVQMISSGCAIENLADCFAGVRDGVIGAAAKAMRT